MKKGIRKTISVIAILTMTLQMGMPMIPGLQTKVFATNTTIPVEAEKIQATVSEEATTGLSENTDTTQTEEISRDYEIKDEETWDVSKNGDGSVIAKWTLDNKTLTISGTGEMKDWTSNSEEDWHDTQYTDIIENVIIENGITNIGEYAFYKCGSLSNIVIPEGVTSIESSAFSICSSLREVNIPESVTNILDDAFFGCTSLENINIPEGVTSIDFRVFKGCSSLQSITIPNNVKRIEGNAFSGCSSLKNINIPSNVTNIGINEFQGIERGVFDGCSSLESINVNDDNKNYYSENGVLFNKEKTKIICYPAGNKRLKEYTIPENVTSIVESAFSGCTSLESINIPEGVTSIKWGTFDGCSSIESINIPEGVTNIENLAFSGCSSLESIEIPEGLTSIGGSAFEGCSSLEGITIPEGLKSIEDYAFKECSSLTSIEIPEGVTSIGRDAFKECSSLKSITIPSSVTNIRKNAFSRCSNLESITISEGVTTIENYVFYRCSSLKSITIPSSVTSIGYSTFSECTNLQSITIPEGVTNIGSDAFLGCSNLESVTISKSVMSIGSGAFEDCDKATFYVSADSEGHKYVEENKCRYFLDGEATEISTNYKIKDEETWDISANGDGSVIAKWTLENKTLTISGTGEMKDWDSSSKEDWHKQYKNIIQKVIIENGVTSIGDSAFYECSSLESITIPEGVKSIKGLAFLGCSSLKSINIPKSVTSIAGGDTFSGCTSLESININANNKNYMSENGILFNKEKTKLIQYPAGKSDIDEYTIPSTAKSIEYGAFRECSSLESIIIPNGVTSIESFTFEGCSSLTSINIPNGVTSIEDYAFNGCSSLESIVIPEGVTSIGEYAFSGCSSLEGITIPEGVTSIAIGLFSKCSNLESIKIPEGVKSIENVAFYNCDNLENITIPEGVTNIDTNSFFGCDKLILHVKADSKGHEYAEKHEIGYILEGEAISIETNYEIKEEETWDVSANGDGSVIAQWTLSNKTLTISGTGKMKNWNSQSKEDWHKQYRNIMQKVIIEEGVTNIGDTAFNECSGLISITIPEGVTTIGNDAFSECSSLKSINIPKSVTSIAGGEIFSVCRSLESINVDANNKNYMSENGILFNKEKTKLIQYPAGKSDIDEYTIPSTVKSIENGAFRECSSLESIIISEGVTSIGKNAFMRCSSLETITIPNGVKSIENGAFSGCSSLESITIPNSVTSIDSELFLSCNNLKSIIIPKGVKSIGYHSFYQCTSLESITIPNSVTSINNMAFYGCSRLIIYTTSNSEGHRYAEEIGPYYAEPIQGYMIDDISPTVTFTPNVGENIQKEYNVEVKVQDNMEEVGLYENGLKYQWTQSEIEPAKERFTESFENGQTITKNTGDGVWYLWVYAKDNVGNEIITRSEGFHFDNTGPVLNITYSTKNPTKENVTVTIISNEQIQEVSGWTLSSDKLKLTKEYSQTATETVTVKDLVGNEAQTYIEINNIDKTAPIVNVEYSVKSPTKENVTVTITSNEQIQEIEGWTLSSDKLELTKEYSQNATETVTIKDLVGNEAQAYVEINNIDKTAPTVNVTYSTKDLTKESVIVTITSNEQIQEIKGWTLSSDKLELTKEYRQNTTETVTIKDLAGNETQVNIEITNIDETPDITIGDINQDGKIDVTDFLMLKRHLVAGNRNNWKLTGDNLLAADMNENGVVDITDMLMLKRVIVENI